MTRWGSSTLWVYRAEQGAFVATYLGQAIGWYNPGEGAGLVGAVVGAVVVLVVWAFFLKRPVIEIGEAGDYCHPVRRGGRSASRWCITPFKSAEPRTKTPGAHARAFQSPVRERSRSKPKKRPAASRQSNTESRK
jgi:Transglycosylase associated protein